MDAAREFYQAQFSSLDAAITALVEEYECALGSEFSRSDLKWHEDNSTETGETAATLMWGETTLLQTYMRAPTPYQHAVHHCRLYYPKRKH